MSLSRLAVLVGTALIGFGLPMPVAAVSPAPTAQREDSPLAVSWLQRAATAPDRVSFHGIQIITSWGPQGASSAMLDILHAAKQGSEISVVGAGPPGAKAFVQRAAETAGPTVDGGPLALLRATYELVYKGRTETIGRPAVLIEALRADRTLAARFWIDKATGLLLQRQLYAGDGRTMVRATVYTELEVHGAYFLSHLPPMVPSGVTSIGLGRVDSLRSRGWNCMNELPASLKLYDVRTDAAGGSLQFSYSDGLFAVSLFEQRGGLDPAAVAGYTVSNTPEGAQVYIRQGMPSYAVWSSGGIVYTLIGDIPYDVLATVVAAFPHEPPRRVTAIERVGTGLAKMAMWITPVGALSRKLG
ncbi:MAG TPA: sigma-E factor regulatory protein RseB domain-containing protein [Kribbella sp.]|nr:sigma-E factor regulatory protein RseB domain-containing protein [Kribbella sp.]